MHTTVPLSACAIKLMFGMQKTLLILFMILIPIWSFSTECYAFGESICYKKNKGWVNCIGETVPNSCTVSAEALINPNDTCLDAARVDMELISYDNVTPKIEEAHYIFPFIIAQALGMQAEAAYWLAIYGSVPDFKKSIPVNKFGGKMSTCTNLHTIKLLGIHRSNSAKTSELTGGMFYHFPARYHRQTNTGIYPNFNDPDEGFLAQLLDYATGKRSNICIAGITSDTSGGIISSTGPTCYKNDLRNWLLLPNGRSPQKFLKYADGTLSYTGDAIVNSTQVNGLSYPTNVTFIDNIQSMLNSGSGTYQGMAVPSDIFNLALALHTRIDRISHAECLDKTVLTHSAHTGHILLHGNTKYCNGKWHAWEHFREFGTGYHSDKTDAAISQMYDDIELFLNAKPQYRTKYNNKYNFYQLQKISKAQLIQDLSNISILKRADRRIASYNTLIESYGMQALPGHSPNYKSGQCPSF